MIDPVALISTDLSHVGHGSPPNPRLFPSFTAAGGKLYVFGGSIGSGGAIFLGYHNGKGGKQLAFKFMSSFGVRLPNPQNKTEGL